MGRIGKATQRSRSLAFCARQATKLQVEAMLLWQQAQAAGDSTAAAELWQVSRSGCEALARLERLRAQPLKHWNPKILAPVPPPGPLDALGVPPKRSRGEILAQLQEEASTLTRDLTNRPQ